MTIYLLLCLLSGLFSLAIPLLVGAAINVSAQPSWGLGGAFGICLMAMAAQGVRVLLAYVTDLLNLDLQAHAGYLINAKTVEHIERLPESFFRGFDSALCSQKVNHDSNDLVIFIMNTLVQMASNVLTVFTVLVVLFVINWKISMICLALGIVAACFYCVSKQALFETGKEVQERSSLYFARLLEQVDSISFIRRHSAHAWFSARLEEAFNDLYAALRCNQKASAGFTAKNSTIEMLAYGCILMLSINEISHGGMDVGYLATALGYYSSLSGAILYFMGWGKSYQDANVCYARLCEIWDLEEEKRGSIAVSSVREISLQNLSIAISPENRSIVYGSLGFARGCGLYAITGANGSGKTTLLNALSGICPGKYEGRIEYDGISLDQIDKQALREQRVGYVEQDPLIVCGSLWDNLTLFMERPDISEVDYYLNRFGLKSSASELPGGLSTLLDGRGRSISGGERQKIAIIRILLKKPEVMLLDEPTSALDESSRSALIETIKEMSKDHLVIIVSHDQLLVDACDEVIDLG